MSSPNPMLNYLPISLRVVAGLVLIGCSFLVARSWLASHDAATALQATMAAQAKSLQQAQSSQDARDASLIRTLSAVTTAKNAVKTPAQAAAQIPQILPPLPSPDPIRIELPPVAAPESRQPTAGTDTVPPPAIATVPQADLKPLYDYLQDCRVCQAQTATAKADLEDERRKTSALTLERDAAIHAAHPTFWSRLGHAAKWAIIGGAVAATAIAASSRR